MNVGLTGGVGEATKAQGPTATLALAFPPCSKPIASRFPP